MEAKRSTIGSKSLLTFAAAPIRLCRRMLVGVVSRFFPDAYSRKRRGSWEARWGREGYTPFFREAEPKAPPEILEAVENQWFPAGGRVLDIGCGDGWLTAWMVDRGFRAMGVDFAKPAIDRAREAYREYDDRLEWKVVDIINDDPPGNDFDILIDRGCLHRIPHHQWPTYCRNVRACAVAGARLVLIVATFQHDRFLLSDTRMSHDRVKSKVGEVFEAAFEIERMEHGCIDMDGAIHSRNPDMPAVTFWMTARG